MSKAATKKLVVCGGNGFLGSRICKYGVARGWDVTSISRSGQPKWDGITSSPTPPPWAHKVSWESADIFTPSTYAPLLKNADYVVQSMGILIEADYKGVLSGKESPIAGLQRAFSATKGSDSKNPLEQQQQQQQQQQQTAKENSQSNAYHKPENEQQLTYEVMNRDSAVLVAKEASQQGVSAFLYVSAAGGAPVLPGRYIKTKRDAESIIASEFPQMRGIFLRPPFLYDNSRKFTLPLAAMTGVGAVFNSLTGGALNDFMGAAGAKPLQVDVVAEAAVEALSDEAVKGPVEVKEIEELATKAWRKGML